MPSDYISDPAEAYRITREREIEEIVERDNRIARARMATPMATTRTYPQREYRQVEAYQQAQQVTWDNDARTREQIEQSILDSVAGIDFSENTVSKSKVDLLEEEVVDLKAQVHEMSKQLDFIKSLVVESDTNTSKMAKVVRSLGKYTPIIIDPSDNRGKQ